MVDAFQIVSRSKACTTIHELIQFHSRYKYLLMMYHQKGVTTLGRICANQKNHSFEELKKEYVHTLDGLLQCGRSKRKVKNAVLHMFGYVTDDVSNEDKALFFETLELYLHDDLKEDVLYKQLYDWAATYKKEYLMNQVVFDPFKE